MAKKNASVYLGMAAFVIAVLAPILAALNLVNAIPYGAWIFSVWMVALLGLLVSIVSKMKKAGVAFLLGAVVLIVVSPLMAGTPFVGALISGLLLNLGALMGGLAIYPLVLQGWKAANGKKR